MSEPNARGIEVHLPTQQLTKVERERQAFLRLLPGLMSTHRGQYVAVYEGKVVGAGTDRLELAMEVWRRIGYVGIYVGLVSDAPEPVERSGLVREIAGENLR